jgi:uncharacterized phiE125 gp8 family phage protein
VFPFPPWTQTPHRHKPFTFSLRQTVPPVGEPVSLELLKQHLYLNVDDLDELLSAYLASARQVFESSTSRQCLPARWELSLRKHHGDKDWADRITLPVAPLIEVLSITYTDTDGAVQPFTDYIIDSYHDPAQIYPTATPARQEGTEIVVTFTAGYHQLPPPIRVALMLLTGHWYANRGDESDVTIPLGFETICDQYRVHLHDQIGEVVQWR